MDYQEKYIQMLKTELGNRILANSRYSMRAMARDLGMEPPRLSMVLNRKRGLSLVAAKKIVENFNWLDDDKETFIKLVQASHARSKKDREHAKQDIVKNLRRRNESIEKFVEDNLFKQIAEPIHYLIIEALKIKNLSPTLDGLCSVIAFPREEIEEAVLRMNELGLLNYQSGKISLQEYIIKTGGKVPSMALRKHHSMIMKSALKAVMDQRVEERSLSSLTVAIPKELIPEVFEKINNFRREINEFIINHPNQDKTDVYCLSSQFFKMSKETES